MFYAHHLFKQLDLSIHSYKNASLYRKNEVTYSVLHEINRHALDSVFKRKNMFKHR